MLTNKYLLVEYIQMLAVSEKQGLEKITRKQIKIWKK